MHPCAESHMWTSNSLDMQSRAYLREDAMEGILCYCLAPGVFTGATPSSTQVVRGRAFEEILSLTLAD